MIRVVIADAHPIMRQGLRALLERTDDIEIIGEAEDGRQVCELLDQLSPQVIILDLTLPRLNGLEIAERLRLQKSPVSLVILSEYCDFASVHQALRSGVCGYLLKRSVADELPLAVRAASRKELYLTPSVLGKILYELIPAPKSEEIHGFDTLTSREREVLQLVAEGRTNRAIAQALRISLKTVEKHRANLMNKLNVSDTASLVRIAVQRGLVSL